MESASERCQNATMCENAESERRLPECNCVRECRELAKAARMRLCVSKLGARETARMGPSERECRERMLPECDCVRERRERVKAARMRPCARMKSASESCQNAAVCESAESE